MGNKGNKGKHNNNTNITLLHTLYSTTTYTTYLPITYPFTQMDLFSQNSFKSSKSQIKKRVTK